MNLILLTTLAFAAAVEVNGATPHELFGAEQLSFVEAPCASEGCAPSYCYPKNEAPDYQCYR